MDTNSPTYYEAEVRIIMFHPHASEKVIRSCGQDMGARAELALDFHITFGVWSTKLADQGSVQPAQEG